MDLTPLIRYLAELLLAEDNREAVDPGVRPTDNLSMDAVIYARYSTDKQRETSIDDAVGVPLRAEVLHVRVSSVHADDGISGSTPVAARPGGRALLADAIAGRFQILLLESLDRLSRDLVEQETIVRRLEHGGIRIIGCSDGYDTAVGNSRKIHRGMRGLINEIYLDDCAQRFIEVFRVKSVAVITPGEFPTATARWSPASIQKVNPLAID